jgi:hypothetical protein
MNKYTNIMHIHPYDERMKQKRKQKENEEQEVRKKQRRSTSGADVTILHITNDADQFGSSGPTCTWQTGPPGLLGME